MTMIITVLECEIQMMRRILYIVLTAPELCNEAKTFDFIINIYKSFT